LCAVQLTHLHSDNIHYPTTLQGGSKLERARDLFEQALEKCPPKFAKPLYLMYGKLEEDYGLARHAMRIYDRATSAVSDEDRFEVIIDVTLVLFLV